MTIATGISIAFMAILCIGVGIPVKAIYDMGKDNKKKYGTWGLPKSNVKKNGKKSDKGLFFSKIRSIFVS